MIPKWLQYHHGSVTALHSLIIGTVFLLQCLGFLVCRKICTYAQDGSFRCFFGRRGGTAPDSPVGTRRAAEFSLGMLATLSKRVSSSLLNFRSGWFLFIAFFETGFSSRSLGSMAPVVGAQGAYVDKVCKKPAAKVCNSFKKRASASLKYPFLGSSVAL